MKERSELLWQRLLATLLGRGLLPKGELTFTPAEVARHVVNTTGDERVRRFVEGYYYPVSYGQLDGPLSDQEAERLVASLEKRPLKPSARAQSAPAAPAPKGAGRTCSICGRKKSTKEREDGNAL